MRAAKQAVREAERRFPVRIRIGVPPEGLGSYLDQIFAWLDANCGADGWTSAPSSTRGVVNVSWTMVGILSGVCAGTAYFLISVLLPKALVDQGAAVSLSFGLTSLVYFASIPGKAFTGFLMEIIGRRWTIFYALAGSLPGLFLMLIAHRAGDLATVAMVTGALITGF